MPYVASRSLRRRGMNGIVRNPDGTFTVDTLTPSSSSSYTLPMRTVNFNCPGDPGCPGYVSPDENLRGLLDSFDTPALLQRSDVPFSFTSFLNQNAGNLVIGAGLFFGLLLFGKAMR